MTPTGLLYRERTKDALYGVTGSFLSLSIGYHVMKGAESVMESYSLPLQERVNYFNFYKGFSQLKDPLLRGALKILAVVYTSVFIPILESWLFHDMIYTWQERNDELKEGEHIRVFRVISNSCIFGAFHFSIFAGWANLPILAVSTVVGVIFAALREIRGNNRATMIAHILNNAIVMLTI